MVFHDVDDNSFVAAHEMWSSGTWPVKILCLLPNGMLIPLFVEKTKTFVELKEKLWLESARFTMPASLHACTSYAFVSINSKSELEEVRDENKKLCEVQPFGGVLKVIKKRGCEEIHNFNKAVTFLLGKGIKELEGFGSPEVKYFHQKIKPFIEKIAQQRRNYSWLQRLRYQFPPNLVSAPIEQYTNNRTDQYFRVIVYFQIKNHPVSKSNHANQNDNRRYSTIKSIKNAIKQSKDTNTDNDSTTENNDIQKVVFCTFSIPYTATPNLLLSIAIRKRSAINHERVICTQQFILKAYGREEYIYGNYKLAEFSYINDALARNKTPILVVVSVNDVPLLKEEKLYDPSINSNYPRPSESVWTKNKMKSSFTEHRKFGLQIVSISNLSSQIDYTEVGLQVGLFHGGKPLCQPRYLKEMTAKDNKCTFEQYLEFDISVSDLPRMAKLCFAVYEMCRSVKGSRMRKVSKDMSNQHCVHPLGWANLAIFNFKNELVTGKTVLYLWSMPADVHLGDLFHPLHTVAPNPDKKNAVTLHFTLNKYGSDIAYPSLDTILAYRCKDTKYYCEQIAYGGSDALQNLNDLLQNVTEKICNADIHEQDRKIVWTLRYHILISMPHLLPKLLDCVDWNNRFEVAEMTCILQKWPLLDPRLALELLDCSYADPAVRSFAVRCLQCARDEFVQTFLLQLVQVLKYEYFLYNDLTLFLLNRAFTNLSIAHYLFWHLRSEMHTKSVSLQFGLILDLYCRGAPHHVKILYNQVSFVEKMKTTTELVRKRKDKEKARQFINEYFQQEHCQEVFRDLISPLDPSVRCKTIRAEKCRVMDSKARPLWLVFENNDSLGKDIYFIFKNGDDLRQDMLTLQLLKIMDSIWKSHGLDLRISSYNCISTDDRVGFIEVVLNAETVANIQKDNSMLSATSAFKKDSIFVWLKEWNPTPSALNKAIEEFTYSCIGYCVATFILGVADRHSDNIMLKRTGQLFHIDFGHILGHFKEKFGFCRERVPFVITHDFVYVINKGQSKADTAAEFKFFRHTCKNAFLIIRKHGTLILTLFAMMISTGLPELSNEADLNYLHNNLVLHLSDSEAEEYFLSKFDEAINNSWKTSLNWASHNVAKNNRI